MEVAASAPSRSFWRHGAVSGTPSAGIQLRRSRNAGRELMRLRAFLCSSSIQDSRSKPWNDANLALELREFMVANGLPSDKVPTTKELASNGRQDLANIVRRRGYKAIAQLLASTPPVPAKQILDDNQELEIEKSVVLNGSARTESEQSKPSHHQLEYLDLIRPPPPDAAAVYSSGSSQSLEEKAEKFLRTGEFSSDQENEQVSTAEESDTESDALEMVALRKAALLRSTLTPFLSSRDREASEKLSATTDKVNELLQDKEKQSLSSVNPPEAQKVERSIPGGAGRSQSGVELSTLTRELEETKAQLALVQAKATAELSQAKQVVMEKDLRLIATEQALANLKQVKVEWWGVASRVELAGSFNGWQHFFVLEPDLSSEIVKPDGARGPLMWETELWLYPGVYEMKFIVDGEWQIDHRREVSMKGINQNNVLRVEL